MLRIIASVVLGIAPAASAAGIQAEALSRSAEASFGAVTLQMAQQQSAPRSAKKTVKTVDEIHPSLLWQEAQQLFFQGRKMTSHYTGWLAGPWHRQPLQGQRLDKPEQLRFEGPSYEGPYDIVAQAWLTIGNNEPSSLIYAQIEESFREDAAVLRWPNSTFLCRLEAHNLHRLVCQVFSRPDSGIDYRVYLRGEAQQ